MLPLADRILLAVRRTPKTARRLCEELGADVSVVHAVLRSLDAAGTVEAVPVVGEQAVAWRLAAGVRVEYQPSVVRVVRAGAAAGAAGPAPAGGAVGGCRATIRASRGCRRRVALAGYCAEHAVREDDLPEGF